MKYRQLYRHLLKREGNDALRAAIKAQPKRSLAPRMPKAPSMLEETLALHLRTAGIAFQREVTFHPSRKWRFDFVIDGHMLAIECEGGIYDQERTAHSSIQGIERDIEKGNAAALLGWTVLRFTGPMIHSGDALQTIETYLSNRR